LASDIAQDSIRLSKGSPRIQIEARRTALGTIGLIREGVERLKRRWHKAKEAVEPGDPELPGEEKIERAFSELLTALDEYSDTYGPREQARGRGRPQQEEIIRVLSAMDRHLEVKTGKPQRRLLVDMTRALFPPLTIGRTENQLRAEIHAYRRRKSTQQRDEALRAKIRSGDWDLMAMEREFQRMRKKFGSPQ
jgi:phage shock protein A